MLKKVIITNYLGESMEYNIEGVQAENPSGLLITSIDGLGPVKANINMTELTATDGQSYNSARLEGRNIVIKARFTHASSIEEARLLSYKYFPIKKKVTIRVETDNRKAETTGYVESNEPDIFSEKSGCQISILCESPFFDAGEAEYKFSDAVPLFKFPFGNASLDDKLIKMGTIDGPYKRTIKYVGDYESGMEMTMEAKDDVYNITINKKGDSKSTTIMTSRMRYSVPDSGSDTMRYSKAVYTWDPTHGYEFFCAMPYDFIYDSAVMYKDKLHIVGIFKKDSGGLVIGIYVWDEYSYCWNEVTTLPEVYNKSYLRADDYSYEVKSIVYKDEIYIFVSHMAYFYDSSLRYYVGYKWNGTEWSTYKFVSRRTSQQDLSSGPIGTPLIFNDKLYLVAQGSTPASQTSGTVKSAIVFVHSDDGDDTALIKQLPYVAYGGSAVVYNNTIHLIGSQSTDYQKRHYKLNGTVSANSWSSVSTLPYAFYHSKAVVFNNEIHIFGRDVNDTTHNNYENKHYKYNGSSWSLVDTIPYYFGGGDVVVGDGKLYLFGTSSIQDGCPATPNNMHLIAGDKVVFTTVSGNKKLKLIRNGVEYNILNALDKDPNWFTLTHGNNFFTYSAGIGVEDIEFSIKANTLYEGV